MAEAVICLLPWFMKIDLVIHRSMGWDIGVKGQDTVARYVTIIIYIKVFLWWYVSTLILWCHWFVWGQCSTVHVWRPENIWITCTGFSSLVVANIFQKTWNFICIFYHFSSLRWHVWLKTFLREDKQVISGLLWCIVSMKAIPHHSQKTRTVLGYLQSTTWLLMMQGNGELANINGSL